MASLKQHLTDGTYYTVINLGGYVTRQIHPDGVAFLKRNGVQLFGEIPSWLMSGLHDNNWLFTKEEMHCWGEIDWSPHWHLIDAPKPKPFPKENPFVTKQRETERKARIAAEEATRQAAEAKRRAAEEVEYRKVKGEAARLERQEAEKAEAKREAARERRRQWAERKRAEARAARLTSDASSDPHHGVDTGAKPPATSIATVPILNADPLTHEGQRSISANASLGSLTQLAPRRPTDRVETSGRAQQAETDTTPERVSLRLFALLLVGFIVVVIVVGQLLDFLPT